MTSSQIFVLIAVIVFAVIAVLSILIRKKAPEKLSPLATIALVLVLAGIIFGNMGGRAVGYPFMGAGVVLAIIDMLLKLRNSR